MNDWTTEQRKQRHAEPESETVYVYAMRVRGTYKSLHIYEKMTPNKSKTFQGYSTRVHAH